MDARDAYASIVTGSLRELVTTPRAGFIEQVHGALRPPQRDEVARGEAYAARHASGDRFATRATQQQRIRAEVLDGLDEGPEGGARPGSDVLRPHAQRRRVG